MFSVYYFTFRFLIQWRQLKTPGREDDMDDAPTGNVVEGDMRTAGIVEALGGRGNIVDVDCCATRLRITVNDPEKVKLDDFKQLGSKGAFIRGQGVQVVYGPHVTLIKNQVEEFIGS